MKLEINPKYVPPIEFRNGQISYKFHKVGHEGFSCVHAKGLCFECNQWLDHVMCHMPGWGYGKDAIIETLVRREKRLGGFK